MPSRVQRPFETFGNHILLRKLEEGSFTELWRAARIEGTTLGKPVALQRFIAGDRQALRQSAAVAKGVVRQLEGSTIVREQMIDVADGVPYVAHEYSGGRSLRGILERATSAAGPHPVPIDQAVAITERLIASAQFLQTVRLQGQRLVHGALIPHLIWITEDGEVRIAGQQMAKGVIASLKDAAVRREIGPYLAPEIHQGSEPSMASDIYSIGATFFLALTGKPPAEGPQDEAIASAVTMFDDEPIPDDLAAMLRKALAAEPSARYASIDELQQAMAKLTAGGRYAPTTFNLAFYLHTLLKKEMEEEAADREEEKSIDVARLTKPKEAAPVVAPVAAAAAATAAAVAPPPPVAPSAPAIPSEPAPSAPPPRSHSLHSTSPGSPLSSPLSAPSESKKSKLPLIAAGVVLLAALGGGGFWLLRNQGGTAPAAAQTAPVKAAPVPADVPILTAVADADPAVAETTTSVTDSATTAVTATVSDEEARKKAFEDEVNRRLREEVTRLQADYEKQLANERQKSAAGTRTPPELGRATGAPATTQTTASAPPAATATVAEARPDPDRLNQQRLSEIERQREETSTAGTVAPTTSAPATTLAEAAPVVPAVPQVREGDLIELSALDRPPALVKAAAPVYPPIARKQKMDATVIVSALVNENGRVTEVRVLRGDTRRVGFDEAAVAAVRQSTFTPPQKDGKRVRTWLAFPVRFELPR